MPQSEFKIALSVAARMETPTCCSMWQKEPKHRRQTVSVPRLGFKALGQSWTWKCHSLSHATTCCMKFSRQYTESPSGKPPAMQMLTIADEGWLSTWFSFLELLQPTCLPDRARAKPAAKTSCRTRMHLPWMNRSWLRQAYVMSFPVVGARCAQSCWTCTAVFSFQDATVEVYVSVYFERCEKQIFDKPRNKDLYDSQNMQSRQRLAVWCVYETTSGDSQSFHHYFGKNCTWKKPPVPVSCLISKWKVLNFPNNALCLSG